MGLRGRIASPFSVRAQRREKAARKTARKMGQQPDRPEPRDDARNADPPVEPELVAGDKTAHQIWQHIVATAGHLTVADSYLLGVYSHLLARWCNAARTIGEKGLVYKTRRGVLKVRPEARITKQITELLALADRLGLTPASRKRWNFEAASKPVDQLTAFLKLHRC